MFPLYYGWFLHITDTQLLVEAARGILENCLDITEFFSDISERTRFKDKKGFISHYSWHNSLTHSTSR